MNLVVSKALAEAIDRDVPIPYHYQLREIMRQEIVTGRWPLGEKLPSERDLCVIFGVSRPTVRGAIEALVDEGFLRREKGRGTFIASPKIVEGLLQTPFGFSDSMQAQNIEFTTRVLTIEVRPAPYIVARELRLSDGAPIIFLERLRATGGEPILTVASYLPEASFPGLMAEDFTRSSLYHVLRTRYGMTMARARRYMEAVPADKHEADLFGVRVGSPLMQIDSTTYTESGTPFEFYRAYHRGDRTRFLVESFRTLVPEGQHTQDITAMFTEESFISS
jgi:GntR family transcriptional regulator